MSDDLEKPDAFAGLVRELDALIGESDQLGTSLDQPSLRLSHMRSDSWDLRFPEGVIAVKPMPKPGWAVETVKCKYQKTYDNFGTPVSEGIQEIVWTGKLLDEHYDEFIFRGNLTDSLPAGQMLYLPVVQECEGGKMERWIEIPAEGKAADDYKFPAPGLKLLPAKSLH